MADMNNRPTTHRDRAQLMLIAGLGLAALLVMLALVLNAVIYTENVASRDAEARDSLEVLRYEHDAVATTHELLIAENEPGTNKTHTSIRANVTRQLGTWSNATAQHAARDAAVVSVSLNESASVDGTRIVQTTERNLTNAGGTPGWSPLTDATAISRFVMTIDREDLVTVTESDPSLQNLTDQNVFSVTVENPTDRYRIFIYDAPTGQRVEIQTEHPSGTLGLACSTLAPTASSTVSIDFLNATVNGDDCEALPDMRNLTGAVTVTITNGDNAHGTYELIGNRDAFDGDINTIVGTDPYGEPVLYAAVIDIRYATPTLTFVNANVRVSGGVWP